MAFWLLKFTGTQRLLTVGGNAKRKTGHGKRGSFVRCRHSKKHHETNGGWRLPRWVRRQIWVRRRTASNWNLVCGDTASYALMPNACVPKQNSRGKPRRLFRRGFNHVTRKRWLRRNGQPCIAFSIFERQPTVTPVAIVDSSAVGRKGLKRPRLDVYLCSSKNTLSRSWQSR